MKEKNQQGTQYMQNEYLKNLIFFHAIDWMKFYNFTKVSNYVHTNHSPCHQWWWNVENFSCRVGNKQECPLSSKHSLITGQIKSCANQ